MDNNVLIPALLTAAVGIFTGFLGYLNGKHKNNIDHRNSLSDDEREFRQELREMVSAYQQQVKDMTEKLSNLSEINNDLRKEVNELQESNESLRNIISTLRLKVEELTKANRELSAKFELEQNTYLRKSKNGGK